MRITLDSFRNVIQQSELLSAEALTVLSQEFDALAAKEADATGEPVRADAKRFAQFLIEKGSLSVWQAENLLRGKHKGFKLGKYRLLALLGKGGMSSVYLAEHTVMKRRVAIKVLPHKKVHDASYLGRFHREAQAVASLDHPNIVRAYDVDAETDGSMEIHFLVMEYVEGKSLQELVVKKGPLSPKEAADYIRQAADGLEHAHAAGLVHRDIKPGNLLVDKNGTVKLLDLGLARFFNDEENSLTVEHDEKVLGTADYLAPEQAVDSHTVDHRADLYSLGCTLFYLLTGSPPFNQGTLAQRLIAHQTKEPPSISETRPDVPESLIALMKRLMSKKPEDRPETAAQASQEFADWLEGDAGKPAAAPVSLESKPAASAPAAATVEVSDVDEGGSEDALGDFLNQLDSEPSLTSGVEMASNSRVGPMGDSNVGTTRNAGTASGPSSNIHGRGPSSIIARRKEKIPKNYLIGSGVALLLLVLAWVFWPSGDSSGPAVVVKNGGTNNGSTGAGDGGTTPASRPPVTGDRITVGAAGNFGTVAEAIAHVIKTFAPFGSNETRTIELAAGETFEESIRLDSSGLDQFPRYVTIETDTANPATVKGDGLSTVLSINAVNELTVRNIVFDAAGASSAIAIEGYAGATRLEGVTATGFSSIGIALTNAAGLSGQQILLDRVVVRAPEGRSPSAGIKLVSGIPETARIRIQNSRIAGPLGAGIEIVGPTTDVSVTRTTIDGVDRGIAFPGAAADFDTVRVIGNTFYQVKTGIDFAQQPAARSKKLGISQNLFSDVDEELSVDSGFNREQFANLLKNGGWFSENFSTRSKPAEPANGGFPIVGDAGYGISAEFASTDRASADYLKPQAEVLKKANGGPDPKFIGAIDPSGS